MSPWNVACPTCGALPGHQCTDMVWHYPIHGYHQTRIDSAKTGGRG